MEQLLAAARSPEIFSEASESRAVSDEERVAIQISGSSFTVAVEREPRFVAKLLRELDDLFRQSFGTRYRIALVRK